MLRMLFKDINYVNIWDAYVNAASFAVVSYLLVVDFNYWLFGYFTSVLGLTTCCYCEKDTCRSSMDPVVVFNRYWLLDGRLYHRRNRVTVFSC